MDGRNHKVAPGTRGIDEMGTIRGSVTGLWPYRDVNIPATQQIQFRCHEWAFESGSANPAIDYEPARLVLGKWDVTPHEFLHDARIVQPDHNTVQTGYYDRKMGGISLRRHDFLLNGDGLKPGAKGMSVTRLRGDNWATAVPIVQSLV